MSVTKHKQYQKIYPKHTDCKHPHNETRAVSCTRIGRWPKKKKKPTSKHRITHIHPDGHQPTNNHATEPNIQYTVAANNQQPIALPRNRIQHPKKTVNTHPTIRRCSKMLHALTNAINSKNEPKHDTHYGCINHFPGNPHQQTTGRACFRWQKTTILQQPTQLLKHTRQKTTIVTSICYAWLHT